MLPQRLGVDVQQPLFRIVRVGRDAAGEDARGAGHLREQVADQAADRGFCGRDAEASLAERRYDLLFVHRCILPG